jgi:cellulose biosynthesis protein BcsQ
VDKFKEAVTVYTNFITPPDFVDEQKHSVLLIDADAQTIVSLSEWCQRANSEYNVYLYHHNVDNQDWLDKVVQLVDVIIVNTEPSSLTSLKDKMAMLQNAYHYGPKRFLGNNQHINVPEEYFERYEQLNK